MSNNPLYVSKRGGTISCFRGDTGLLFLVYSDRLSLFCNDLWAAKAQLDRLEGFQDRSGEINLQAMNQHGKSLRDFVESAAAPYLEE